MFAEIITIGDELLIGQVVDTNSAWIGQKLNKIGIEVLRIVSIRDREDEILEAIDNAMKRVNIVLVTGGLGPTKDDITKQTLCKYFHTRLVFSEEVFENIKRVLAGKIPMNALNKGQAMVPEGCTVINNPVGSASVSWFERNDRVLVSMPGVPQEMKVVMTESILPKLHEKFQTDVIMHQTFLVQHYPESVLAEKLETVISRNVTNTRMRDFYDIYILQKLYGEQLSKDVLWDALVATAKKRETLEQIETEDIDEVFDEIQSSSVMENLWKAYQRNYSYSADIPWHTIMKSIRTLYEIISKNTYNVLRFSKNVEKPNDGTTKQGKELHHE